MGIKRGQVTIFLTIGIVILISIFLIFLVRAELIGKLIKEQRIDPNLKDINARVTSCIEDLGKAGLNLVGLQGGKITLRPDTYMEFEGAQISYLGFHEKNLVPSDDKVGQELSLFMGENLPKCAEGFEFQPYPVKQGRLDVKTEIKDNKVIFNVGWPLVLTKDGRNYQIKDFRYETPEKNTDSDKMLRLGNVLKMTRSIVDNFCVTRDVVDGLLKEYYPVNIDYINIEDDIVYFIEDNDYLFTFAVNKCVQ